ncbi:MAG: helix-turn-helix domain-containing protein, partial [Candidatus Gracilibacteria bacterium]|nr:helix-turn-helix domain-containing protein [Candidatus Gracilibacteria bacterium]
MRYISLTEGEELTLEKGHKHHLSKDFRNRCQALLMSYRGIQVKHISSIFQVRTRTIYTWMDRWESEGISGLMIRSGRGRKPKLS